MRYAGDSPTSQLGAKNDLGCQTDSIGLSFRIVSFLLHNFSDLRIEKFSLRVTPFFDPNYAEPRAIEFWFIRM